MKCRHCHQKLEHEFLDLGFAPPSNAYLSKEDLSKPELFFPLKLYVCHHCFLVQTEDYACANQRSDTILLRIQVCIHQPVNIGSIYEYHLKI